MGRRRFELAGIPGSFFEVRVDGTNLYVSIGPRGRPAREQLRAQPSAAAATAEMERLIAAHLAKGYVETAPLVPVIARPGVIRSPALDEIDRQRMRLEREAEEREQAHLAKLDRARGLAQISHEPALESQCRLAPDDPAPWAVYTDWLIGRGDPRGEIAARIVAGDREGAAKRIALHYAKLTGLDEPHATFTFRHGFVSGVTTKNPDPGQRLDLGSITTRLLASPIATFLESLQFGLADFASDNTWRPALEVIVGSPVGQRMRTLRFDAYGYDDCMMHWVNIGDLSGLLDRLPNLERLHLRGDEVTYGTIDLPALQTFVRESCTLHADEVARLCDARWPALEHLELWFGSAHYGVEVGSRTLAPMFAARGLPRLGHLGLVNCDAHADLIPALVSSKLLPQLYSLDLSKGTIGTPEVDLLVRHANAFRHLASLDLEDNFLTADDEARIRSVLDNVIIGSQREDDEAGEDDEAPLRYVVEYE